MKDLKIPELPSQKREKFIKLGIANDDAFVLSNDYSLARFFEDISRKIDPVFASKWIRKEVTRVLNYNSIPSNRMKLDPEQFVYILKYVKEGKITEKTGKKLLEKLVLGYFDVSPYITEKNLGIEKRSDIIEGLCKFIIEENAKAVEDYKKGKEKSFNYLFGQVMKKSKGKTDPTTVKNILKRLIENH